MRLPTPETFLDGARDLEKIFAADATRAREALRGVFDKGVIPMHPGADGTYAATATFLPLAAVVADGLEARTGEAPVAVPFRVTVPKPPDRWRKNQ